MTALAAGHWARPGLARSAQPRRDRFASLAAVVAIHALLGFILVRGLEVAPLERPREPARFVGLPPPDIPEPPEPPTLAEELVPTPAPATISPQGDPAEASAPPSYRRPAKASAAPSPPARKQRNAAPLPEAPAQGGETAGAGAGGSGLAGVGAGSGTGDGAGSGGIATGAWQRSGRLVNADYPRSARLAGAEGTVFVRFTVGPDGRASRCVVTRTSGHADLDATTCRLIERRFRYEPARDALGRPVADVIVGRQRWWLDRGGADASDAPPASNATGSQQDGRTADPP